jgi:hypothetical protein
MDRQCEVEYIEMFVRFTIIDNSKATLKAKKEGNCYLDIF